MQANEGAAEGDVPEERVAKRRRTSDRGEAAARAAQELPSSQIPKQPMSSWEPGMGLGSLAASGPQKDAITAVVAKAAVLAAAVSPSSILSTLIPTCTRCITRH